MIRQHVITAWASVMDEERNPLRKLPLMTAHMLMQVLAWMWSAIFSVAIGSYVFFGISVIGHALIIAGIVVTLAVFHRAEPRNQAGA